MSVNEGTFDMNVSSFFTVLSPLLACEAPMSSIMVPISFSWDKCLPCDMIDKDLSLETMDEEQA